MTDTEFRRLFGEHKNSVYQFALRMMAAEADAEDVAQEVFLAVWKNPSRYTEARGAMRPFLLGVTRNLVLKRWRSLRPTEELDADTLSYAPIDLVEGERQRAIASAVEQLPVLQREALILAEYEELSLDEIAQVTAADLAAVKSRLYRARQNLRRLLINLLPERSVHEA